MAPEQQDEYPLQRRLHWHNSVHKEWGKERLYFYRLGFAPIYNLTAIERALSKLFARHRIGSQVTYELYGNWDLLVRLWLPSDVQSEDFDLALRLRGVRL